MHAHTSQEPSSLLFRLVSLSNPELSTLANLDGQLSLGISCLPCKTGISAILLQIARIYERSGDLNLGLDTFMAST